MRQKIVFLLIVVAFVAALAVFWRGEDTEKEYVRMRIGGGEFTLRIANNNAERTRGLGGIEALAPDEGMFFVFPNDALHAIWMKNMLLPIDILWLSASNEVVDLREGVAPDSFPAIFTPRASARFVVELPAGSLTRFPARVGERIEIRGE